MKIPLSFSLYLKEMTSDQLNELLEWNSRDRNANKHVNKEIEREINNREQSQACAAMA